jgi:hypothetical protein
MVTLKNSTSSDKRTKEAAKQTKESPQNKEDVHSLGFGTLAAHREASSNPPSSSHLRNDLTIHKNMRPMSKQATRRKKRK